MAHTLAGHADAHFCVVHASTEQQVPVQLAVGDAKHCVTPLASVQR